MGPLFSDPRRKPAPPAGRWFAGNSSIDLQSTTLSQYRTLWSKVKYDHERRINPDGQAFARETTGNDPRESEEPQIEEPQIGEPVVQSKPALVPTPAAATPPRRPPDRDPRAAEEPRISEPVVLSNPALIPTPAAAAPPPPPPPPPQPSWVMVTFNVHATTRPGETIHLTGSLGELRNWNPDRPISLDCSQSYPTWTTTVKLPRSTTFKYKYIRKWTVAKPPRWESDPDRSFTTPPSGSCFISDIWR